MLKNHICAIKKILKISKVLDTVEKLANKNYQSKLIKIKMSQNVKILKIHFPIVLLKMRVK
jgi:hypothetical protein